MNSLDVNKRERPYSPPGRRRPNWRWWISGFLVTGVVIAASTLSPYLRHQWAISLGRQSTSYTELGFSDASALPAVAKRGKAVSVSFRVSNDGTVPVSYKYVISSGSGSKLSLVSSFARSVGPGQTWTVNRMVVPVCTQSTCRVQVSLPAQNEQIYFLLKIKG